MRQLFSLKTALALALGLVASSAALAANVRLATQPWLGYGQWYVAQDQDIFKKNDLNVNIINFTEDKDRAAAMISGHVDMADMGTQNALALLSKKIPVKIVMIEDESMTADAILADKSIATIADMKGQSIGFEQGSTSDILLRNAVAAAGLKWSDIKPNPMGADVVGTALAANRLKIGVSYEPYLTMALKQNKNLHMIYSGAKAPGLISDVLVVRDDFIKSNPDAVKAMVKSWAEAVAYYNANTDVARAIISKAVGSSPDDLQTAFDGIKYYDGKENAEQLDGAYRSDIFPMALKASTEAGLVDAPVAASEAIDSSFVKGL